jgi:CheY-like chemotaxis protein
LKFNRVLSNLKQLIRLLGANNGEEAIAILKEKEIIPDIIVLDLNMPKINGIEFLGLLKSDDYLKYIPAIVLTTSSNSSDLLQCYRIGIAGYILRNL